MGRRSALSRSVREFCIHLFHASLHLYSGSPENDIFLLLGFLDGGDRTMALASDQTSSASSDSRNGPGGGDSRLTATIPARTSFTAFPNADPSFLPAEPTNVALLVTNLPPLLFSQISDLEPLLCPYGPIVRVEFLGSCSGLNSNLGPGSNIDQNTNRNLVLDGKMTSTSVIVEYTNLASAQEAKLCLHGQVYAGFGLEVDYVRGSPAGRTGVPVLASFHVATLPSSPNTMPQTYSGSGSGVKKAEHRDENNNGPFSYMSLNPLAAPFVLNTHSSQQDFSSVAANVGAGPDDKMHSFNPFFHNQLLGAQPSGLLADVQAKPEARCQNRSRKNGHQRGYQHYEYQNSTYALPNRPFGYDQTSTSTTGTGLKSGFVNLKYVHPCLRLRLIEIFMLWQAEFRVPRYLVSCAVPSHESWPILNFLCLIWLLNQKIAK